MPQAVFRVDRKLVQVDAVVTDKAGRHVSDLGCEDFEIFEDNRSQPVSNCSFVSLAGAGTESSVDVQKSPILGPEPFRRRGLQGLDVADGASGVGPAAFPERLCLIIAPLP